MIYKDTTSTTQPRTKQSKQTMRLERLHTRDLNNMRLQECDSTSLATKRKSFRRLSSIPDSLMSDMSPTFESTSGPSDPRPKKTGVVSMVHPTPSGVNIKLRVRLSVHESYAVVSPDKEITRDMGYVNLRRSSIERIENTNAFQIVPQDCDANALTFYVSQEHDLLDWIDSLRGNNKSSVLRRTYKSSGGPTRRWSAPVGTFMPVIEED